MKQMNSFSLRNGSAGQEVRRLQTKLSLKIDGDFGPKTEAAVRDFQCRIGLYPDGVAGQKTLHELNIPVYAGIDVSGNNGIIDWKQVATDDVTFAWIKCSEGTTFKDKSRKANFSGARKNNIVVGGYHFARPDNGPKQGMQDALDEADNFLTSVAIINPGDLLPVLDLEAGVKTDDSYNAEWALTWLRQVETQSGARPAVYCAKWAADLFLRDARPELLQALATYPCWWAGYNTGVEPKRGVTVWSEWDVWQWSGSGSTLGIKGKCDKNWSAGGRLSDLRVK